MIGSFDIVTVLQFLLRWLHFFFGVMWIGHLYYFNFTQGAFLNATDVDNSAKSALRIKLLPEALYWFRWGAMWTAVTGVIYWSWKAHESHVMPSEFLQSSYGLAISTGALLGLTMWYNVWFVIWPRQQIVIQNAKQVAAGQAALPGAADAGARANVASRTNTLMSIPMLFFMGAASHLPLPVSSSSNFMLYWILFLVLWGAIVYNTFKGKTYKIMTTVKQVITSGFVLTAIIFAFLVIAL